MVDTIAGAAATAGAIAGGAAAAAAGSVVSQGVGVASGLQSSFSWKGVGLAALSGGIGGGLGASGLFGKTVDGAFKAGSIGIKSGLIDAAVRGAASNALTQGVGVATGLQSKFSWTGVAAAGVAAGVGSALGGRNGLAPLYGDGARFTAANIGAHLGVGAARSIAAAATRSVIEGTDFGDNIIATLPDVLAQTVVDVVAGAVTGRPISKNAAVMADSLARKGGGAQGSAAGTAFDAPLSVAELAKADPAAVRRFNASIRHFESASSGHGGIQMIGGESFSPDTDLIGEIRHRYSAEGVVETLVDGVGDIRDDVVDRVQEASRDIFTFEVETSLEALISGIKLHPLTTPLAREILDTFVSDTENRTFEFDSRTPEGREAWRELLTTGPREFFQSYLDNAVIELAKNSGGGVPMWVDGGWVLRDGAEVKEVLASNALTQYNRENGTAYARGAFLDIADLNDGAQLGDVVGSIWSGMDAHVKDGFVIFSAENRTTLESAAYGNVTRSVTGSSLANRMNIPETGRFSTVIQRFRLEVPISDIRNVTYRPR